MEEIHCDRNSKCAPGEGEGGLEAGRSLSSHHRPHSAMPLLSSIFLALSSKTVYRGNGFSPVEREERRKLPARPA